jgi:hypothetical protein
LILAALLLLAACGRDREETGAGTATPPEASSGKLNVILIVADDLNRNVFERSTLDSAWAPEGRPSGTPWSRPRCVARRGLPFCAASTLITPA